MQKYHDLLVKASVEWFAQYVHSVFGISVKPVLNGLTYGISFDSEGKWM